MKPEDLLFQNVHPFLILVTLYHSYEVNGGNEWHEFVYKGGLIWEKMNLDWYHSYSEDDKYIIFYDQLVYNTSKVLQEVADFLSIPTSNAIWECVMKRKNGIFRRKKKNAKGAMFSDAMKKYLEKKRISVYHELKKQL